MFIKAKSGEKENVRPYGTTLVGKKEKHMDKDTCFACIKEGGDDSKLD